MQNKNLKAVLVILVVLLVGIIITVIFVNFNGSGNSENENSQSGGLDNANNSQQEEQENSQNLTNLVVFGNSMSPTFENGDIIQADMSYYSQNSIQRNDLVAIKFSTIEQPFIKRVIAIPNDEISLENNKLYVNEEDKGDFSVEEDSFLLRQLDQSVYKIPEMRYLVLGDNRDDSKDSRQFGLISKSRIIGKAQNSTLTTNV